MPPFNMDLGSSGTVIQWQTTAKTDGNKIIYAYNVLYLDPAGKLL